MIGPEALARGLSYDLPFPSVPISAIEHSKIFLTVLVIYYFKIFHPLRLMEIFILIIMLVFMLVSRPCRHLTLKVLTADQHVKVGFH